MYIKVHKKGNQWFRDDNGALLGEDVTKFPEHPQVNVKDTTVIISKGYLDENGFFIPLCTINPTHCNYKCALVHHLSKPNLICLTHHSNEPTFGYYANVPHYLNI